MDLIKINWLVVMLTGLVPLLTGFIWYNKNVMGTAWMNATGMTPEKAKNSNMVLIFGLTALFGIFIATALLPLTIHQMGAFSVLANELEAKDPAVTSYFQDFMSKYGTNFRTFKHGAFHGIISSIFIALPIISINALFEQKGFKYIAVNVGYWALTLALMGGIICQWA